MGCGTRSSRTAILDGPVSDLKYIDARRAHALAGMGIETVRELIANYPRRYLDMSHVTPIARASIGESVTVVGTIGEVKLKKPRPRLTIVEASLLDDTGVLFGTWFSQPWMANRLHVGDRVALSGKVEFNFGFKRMNSPFSEVIESTDDPGGGVETTGLIVPIHPLTASISGAWMRRFILTALQATDGCLDPIPASLRVARGLIGRRKALYDIHFASTMEDLHAARDRLVYDELIELQLFMGSRLSRLEEGSVPFEHRVEAATQSRLASSLPFELSEEQKRARDDILADMCAPRMMNRMLLGDVGTGKTVVAACALAAVADSGTQAAMMAPTTVLASQYVAKLGPLLDRLSISWAALTGATPPAERAEILRGLADGTITVLLGTHALISADVVFKHMTLAIIDEQHRFGVDQRDALRGKGPGCDFLTMTATPIPRTLALTIFGDLECSYLRRRPVATKPPSTEVISPKARGRAYEAIQAAVDSGRQAYIICPLVGAAKGEPDDRDGYLIDGFDDMADDLSDAKAAVREATYLSTKVFPNFHVGLLTGRMSTAEKTKMMEDFRSGNIDVLVSTTVVEVGVDVPNATVMLIEDADRFGLTQLHQLRGRVGRGRYPGTVYLIANPRSDDARARLDALSKIDDGFELAEFDLRLRREGDILGSRQSGVSSLKLVNIIRDGKLIEWAHEDSRAILATDRKLERCDLRPLACEMAHVFGADEVEVS